MSSTSSCPLCGKPLAAGAPHGLCPACLLKAGVPTGTPGPVGARSKFIPPAPRELARDFPQLEIIELIGQGGMGAVYRARQPSLDRIVALKILPPQTSSDPGFAERFTREARALARLSHANIVAVHDFGQAGAFPYLVMEFVDGVNLRHLLAAGKMAPAEALAIVPPICDALQYAHDRGIVHRDIKPENILLGKNGAVKIADFGLAKLVGADATGLSLTGERDVMGTPYYMAPEQVERPLEVDHRADIYSLGVVFYQMLTGELPLGRFAAPSRKVTIDVRLDEVVLRALEKAPEQRYQQANALKTEVETIATTNAAAPSSTVIPPVDPEDFGVQKKIRKVAITLGIVHGLSLVIYSGTFLAAILGSSGSMQTKTGETIGGAIFHSYLPGFIALLGTLTAPGMVAGVLGLHGARRMYKLRSYNWAIVAGAIAIVSPLIWPIGFPIGIWAIWMMTCDEVRAEFAKHSFPKTQPSPHQWSNVTLRTAGAVVLALLGIPFAGHQLGFFGIDPNVTFFPRPAIIGVMLLVMAGTSVAVWVATRRWRMTRRASTPGSNVRAIGLGVIALILAGVTVALYRSIGFTPYFGFGTYAVTDGPKVDQAPAAPLPGVAPAISSNALAPVIRAPSSPAIGFDAMENDPEILREQLQLAESELSQARAKFDAGLTTSSSVVTAERQVSRIKAKLAGDRVGFARAEVEAAQKIFDEANARRASGIATDADVRTAKADLRIAEIHLRQEAARAKAISEAGAGTAEKR